MVETVQQNSERKKKEVPVMAKVIFLGILAILVLAMGCDRSAPTPVPTSTPVPQSSVVHAPLAIELGTLLVRKSSTAPFGGFPINASDVILGEWELEAIGEGFEISRADLAIKGSTSLSDFKGNVRLVTNAGQVLYYRPSPIQALFDDDPPGSDVVTFDESLIIPVGKVVKVSLVVDSSSSVLGGEVAIGAIGAIYAKRLSSKTFTTVSPEEFIEANTRVAKMIP